MNKEAKQNKKPKFKKKRTWIIAIAVFVIIVFFFTFHTSPGTVVRTAKVKKSNIKSYISNKGKTNLPKIYKITMPYSSRILPVTIKTGAKVKNGEAVASLDLNEIKTKVKVAEAKLKNIEGQIKLNEYREFWKTALNESSKWTKTMEELLKMTKIEITANQHVLDYAIQHKNALIQSGRAVSRINKNEAEMQAAVKEVELQKSRFANRAMDIITKIFKLCPVYISEHLKSLNIEKGVLSAQQDEAAAELKLAKIHFNMAKLKSPVDGVILNKYIKNERFLQAGTEILDIGIMKNLEVSSNILTIEAININKGDEVDIYGEVIGTHPIRGKVTKIEPRGFTDISSLGVKQQKVKVKIAIEKSALKKLLKNRKHLGVGYRVYVRIYTSEAKNTLVVPRTALFKGSGGQWDIFIVKDGKSYLKKVTVGIMNDKQVQITSGLKVDDKVIIAPPTSLKNGSKVSVL
ncbi:MAG: HlyD family efflux transporter periplasmic adaptor subunit [Victivallales bacterium]|nr:HlyD family efflux transporter periplasmic adaptor subunit [Victivallales bacterium]MCF7889037.1 HlyD family efflux transporter periplasmic adaptor subunit [Victivallales bacterium]